MQKQLTLEERLCNSFTINEMGCHEWNKAISKKGYGVLGIGSRLDNSRRTLYAHRLSWELYYKESIPNDLSVLHICDNPRCINPSHLFLGTSKDNTQDMINKNREANKKGVIPFQFKEQIVKVKEGKFAKLNKDQVKEIKKLIAKGIVKSKIAEEYNVSTSCISDIKRNATWVNV